MAFLYPKTRHERRPDRRHWAKAKGKGKGESERAKAKAKSKGKGQSERAKAKGKALIQSDLYFTVSMVLVQNHPVGTLRIVPLQSAVAHTEYFLVVVGCCTRHH